MKAKIDFGSLLEKLPVVILLTIVSVWVMPHTSSASTGETPKPQALVFDIKQKEELQTIYGKTLTGPANNILAESLKSYLESKNSPLADCSEVIVTQDNWKKILGLANAESGLGKRYPKNTNNLWGVGGSNLWKMGDNVCEAVIEMNDFLENFPKRSKVKYAEMSISKMNGLYKQPYGLHWQRNIEHTINQLNTLEKEALEIVSVGSHAYPGLVTQN